MNSSSLPSAPVTFATRSVERQLERHRAQPGNMGNQGRLGRSVELGASFNRGIEFLIVDVDRRCCCGTHSCPIFRKGKAAPLPICLRCRSSAPLLLFHITGPSHWDPGQKAIYRRSAFVENDMNIPVGSGRSTSSSIRHRHGCNAVCAALRSGYLLEGLFRKKLFCFFLFFLHISS